MEYKKMIKRVYNRLVYGCDLEDYSSLVNGGIEWSTNQRNRINLLIGTIDRSKMYGGLTTVVNFYSSLSVNRSYDFRIIVTDVSPQDWSIKDYPGYVIDEKDDSRNAFQIFDYTLRKKHRPIISIRRNDIFVCTYWTTMYLARELRKIQAEEYGCLNPIIYLIQDYEPGFYRWSSEYMLVESTYREEKTIAVINSHQLFNYMKILKYKFYKSLYFEPKLNSELRKILMSDTRCARKNRIIIYGRPFNGRNCFSLIVAALKDAINNDSSLSDWEFWSIGSTHKSIKLSSDNYLICKGKLSIEDYGKLLLESRVGISLMCSPHPSYPPLEMATFGVRTITNTFVAKDLSSFNDNIVSLEKITITSLSAAIRKCCNGRIGIIDYDSSYIEDKDQFSQIVEKIYSTLQEEI